MLCTWGNLAVLGIAKKTIGNFWFLVFFHIFLSHAANAAEPTITFNIPQQNLGDALPVFGQQADVSVVYQYDLVRNHQANRLQGEYTLSDAVAVLLRDTGLTAKFEDSRHLSITTSDNSQEGQEMKINGSQPKKSILAAVIGVIMGGGGQVVAQQQENQSEAEQGTLEEIVVTGFASSLRSSLEARRSSTTFQESIFAEDIGKFPDLNLAEALQRTPGVAIQRDNGEGRTIQLRGLGSEFNRVLLNGVPLSTANNGRSVDFDVFPSELFTRIEVDKTARASHVEGGVAGVIGLRNARPFDFADEGPTVSVSLQGSQNSLTSGEYTPRAHLLVSNTFNDDKIGVLAGIAHSERALRTDTQHTIGWGSSGLGCVIRGYEFRDVTGDGIIDNESGLQSYQYDRQLAAGGTPADRESCNVIDQDDRAGQDSGELERVLIPRLQRTDLQVGDRDRTGFVGALQFRPTEDLDVNIDYFRSELSEIQERHHLDLEWRTQTDLIPIDWTVSEHGTLLHGTVANTDRRDESVQRTIDDEFEQFSFSAQWRPSSWVTLDFSAAQNESNWDYYEQSILYEIVDSTVTVDYSTRVPTIESDVDVTDPANYNGLIVNVENGMIVESGGTPTPSVATIRNDIDLYSEENTSVHFDATFGDDMQNIRVGIAHDEFTRKTIKRDRNVVATEIFEEFAGNRFLPNEQGTKLLSDLGPGFGDVLGQPDGALSDHVIADFAAFDAHWDGGNRAVLESAVAGPEDTPTVEESALGLYTEINTVTSLLNRDLRVNAGIRGVKTEQTSINQTPGGSPIFVERSYWDILPSFNLAYDVHDDVVLRLSGAQTMSRPDMGQLEASTDFSISRIATINNPNLSPFKSSQVDVTAEWYFRPASMIGINFFYKQLDGFIEETERNGVFTDTGIDINSLDPNEHPDIRPDSVVILEEVRNSDKVLQVQGLEAVLQLPLDDIMPIPGFGILANYTRVSADDEVTGLSPDLYNLVGYYENERFAIRGSYNYRSSFVTALNPRGRWPIDRYRDDSAQLDISAQYYIPGFEDVVLTLEGLNVTNETEYNYYGVKERNEGFTGVGRTFVLGVRATF